MVRAWFSESHGICRFMARSALLTIAIIGGKQYGPLTERVIVLTNAGRPAKLTSAEGSHLGDIPNCKYDFVLSSHSLEHMANPIKALKEWQRVVKPGGHFLIVLPYHLWTFDRMRIPTAVEHMLEDYDRKMGEDDLTHIEEICATRVDEHPSRMPHFATGFWTI